MLVALISTYDLGRQPFGLASPAAWLRDSGFQTACFDTSRQALDPDVLRRARLCGFFLPMHTATRLLQATVQRVRAANVSAHLCAYGLYAPPNEGWLRSLGIDTVLGGEFEEQLIDLARSVRAALEGGHANASEGRGGQSPGKNPASPGEWSTATVHPDELLSPRPVPRLTFRVPDRGLLPALSRYARLQLPDGRTRTVGSTEASRGCKHLCRHCPVVTVYGGQFRIVAVDVVLADIRQQVEAGATHITFGDPDFFNGPGHAMRIVDRLATEHPGVTYDVTIKVEHLLRHSPLLRRLRDTGCLFVTTAVESVDEGILKRLAKGHTLADFERVVNLCRDVGLGLAPTFIPFTPWTTVEGYRTLLDTVDALDLQESVPPIQLTIRLLIPEGSALLTLPDIRSLVGRFDPHALVYPWRHPDARVDALQCDVTALVQSLPRARRGSVFERVRALADRHAGIHPSSIARNVEPRRRTEIPYLTEPWFC